VLPSLSFLHKGRFPLWIRLILKVHTFSSPIVLLTNGLPTFPLTFLPNTSCFVRVNLVSKELNCSSICFSFSVLSTFFVGIGFRFRFPWEGRVIEERDSLNLFSCDPFFTILSFFQYRERSCLSSAVFLVLVIVFGCFPRDNFFAAKTAIERSRSSGTPYGPCRFRFPDRSIISPSERNCNRHRDNATISKETNQHESEAEVSYILSNWTDLNLL
jgi:hypothetical protein